MSNHTWSDDDAALFSRLSPPPSVDDGHECRLRSLSSSWRRQAFCSAAGLNTPVPLSPESFVGLDSGSSFAPARCAALCWSYFFCRPGEESLHSFSLCPASHQPTSSFNFTDSSSSSSPCRTRASRRLAHLSCSEALSHFLGGKIPGHESFWLWDRHFVTRLFLTDFQSAFLLTDHLQRLT